MAEKLSWQESRTPAELRSMLSSLEGHYPVFHSRESDATALEFEKTDKPGTCEIQRHKNRALVRYASPAQAGRAIGALLGGVAGNGKYLESTSFTTTGIMLDCSRNAVIRPEHLETWLRRLALLGYNMLMLYTEETYQLPGEPWFGYQRGAYTADEIKRIDDYAARLNIEVIPCIQTLGHLEKILKYPAYREIEDTPHVIMVGEPKTWRLIEKMLDFWKSACRSRRIHIGMDETHNLGRGRYLDKNGYRPGFDIFNEHLEKVKTLCEARNLKPMIWSDMYFRLGSATNNYYDRQCVIPPEVVEKIPAGVELVYWDYYNKSKDFYEEWIARHRAMGREPLMASGIWTWSRYWYDRRLTEETAGPCIEACREAGVKEIFFTQWGDGGAFCDHDSAFAGMAWCADKCYGKKKPSRQSLEKRFGATCGGSYSAHILASEIQGEIEGFTPRMWDDPFQETTFRTFALDDPARMKKIASGFARLARRLEPLAKEPGAGDLGFAHAIASAFAARYTLTAELNAAWRKKDRAGLKKASQKIPAAVKAALKAEKAYRKMWLNHNKPEGLDVIQGRLGMIEARYREMERSLSDYLSGRMQSIAELDHQCPPS